MGRPALNLLRIHVMLSAHALDRIDTLVGEKGRSAFVRKAVDRLLDSAELMKKIESEKK